MGGEATNTKTQRQRHRTRIAFLSRSTKDDIMLPIEKDLAAQIEQDQNWILRYVAAHEAGIVDYHNRLTFDHVDHMNARHPLRR